METRFETGCEVSQTSLAQLHAIQIRGQELLSRREKAIRAELARSIRSLRKRAKLNATTRARGEVKQQAYHLLKKAEELYRQVLDEARRDCASLAVSLAEQIIGANLKRHPEGLAKHIAEALSQMSDIRGTKIGLHPDQVDEVKRQLLEAGFESSHLIPNPEISIGDAIIESSSGSLELSWRERLEILRVRILATLSNQT